MVVRNGPRDWLLNASSSTLVRVAAQVVALCGLWSRSRGSYCRPTGRGEVVAGRFAQLVSGGFTGQAARSLKEMKRTNTFQVQK